MAEVRATSCVNNMTVRCGFYEVRITLNGEPLYARLCDSQEAVNADADGAITDLLRAGWQLRGGDDGSSDYDS